MPPNIVLLISEDFSPFTGAYGDTLACTPNLDRLASDGTQFLSAFCTSPVCAPSRFSLLSGLYPHTCGPANQMQARAHLPVELPTMPELLMRAGYYCTNSFKEHYNCDVDSSRIWHESSRAAHWRNRPAGMPFFASFAELVTHESALFHEQPARVQPADVSIPAYLPDTTAIRADMARYYSAVDQLDRGLGGVLAQLEDDDLTESTVVIWTSDHGGVLPRSKRFCYDEGLRVPLVVRVPTRWSHLWPWSRGDKVSTAVSLIDLVPTILHFAGVRSPEHIQGRPLNIDRTADATFGYAFSGRDRMDERYDTVRTVRDERYRYIRNYAPHRPYGQHYAFAWNARGYQSWEAEHRANRLDSISERFWETKPVEELYDTWSDRDEVANLVGFAEHAKRLDAFRTILDRHCADVYDSGFIPEGSSAEGYHAARDPGLYPVSAVQQLARLAVHRDAALIPRFVAALDENNELLRYWGAQGLLLLGKESQPAAGSLSAHLDDPVPFVRVAMAEAYAWAGGHPVAADRLICLAGPDHDWRVRLAAFNALTYLPEPACSALAVAEAAQDDDNEYVRGAARYLCLLLREEYTPDAQIFDMARHSATSNNRPKNGDESAQ